MNGMSRFFKKISLALAVVLLLQISLQEWLTLSQPIKAAALGPVIISKSPADDLQNVATNAKLSFTVDEIITKENGSASIIIYEYHTNAVFESFVVASSGAVTIDSTGRNVMIQPSKPFQVNTEYYVIIEPGAFANVSNGANFNGIATTYEWNFKTVVQVDSIPPVLQTHSPVLSALDVPITTSFSMVFDEGVYVASGEFSLVSDGSPTTYDDRQIPVTSNQVTGSGTKTITITPSVALYPNTTYTLSIPNGVIQDSAGNKYPGYSWSFKTAAAPLNAIQLYPVNNATSVPVAQSLQINFDKDVAANVDGAARFIHLVRVDDNYDEKINPADTTRVSITGSIVTITSQKMRANTEYYILINPGAFKDKATGEWYHGISNASTWNFKTGLGAETTPPLAIGYTPAQNGVISTLSSKLEITFDEPVYPNSGNIEILTVVNNALFRSIPVTSDSVTGGGTTKITIDPNKALYYKDADKPFVNNSQYYVVIGNMAFRDAAGNFFGGISAQGWSFRVENAMPAIVNTDAAVQQITSMTAAAGGNVTSDGGAVVTERGIVYSSNPNPTIADGKATAILGGTGAFSVELAGLKSGSTYYIRAYAVNGVGVSYGQEIAFSTLSSNASLDALSLSGVTLDQTVSGSVYDYTASVPNSLSSFTITATLSDVIYGKVTANVYNSANTLVAGPVSLASGETSMKLPFEVGSNRIELFVIAQDGTSTKYTVTITRAVQDNGSDGSGNGGNGNNGNNGNNDVQQPYEPPSNENSNNPKQGESILEQPAKPVPAPTEPEQPVKPVPTPEEPKQPEKTIEPTPTIIFNDISTNWAKDMIEEIAARGIITGYPDGTFRPNEPIQRQHVAIMLVRAFQLTANREEATFRDVPKNHSYYDAITLLQQAGIVDGSNGAFNPNANMTRAQIAKVLVLILGIKPGGTSTFQDVSATHWSHDYIAALEENGIVLGDNGNFRPDESMTRAQFVAIMHRALNL